MAPDFSKIPNKVYFRIGEVSELVGVESHVLRYWESEFSLLRPHRGKSKQRLYRRKDIEALLSIKDLLHHQGYTISGAKRFLKEGQQSSLSRQGASSVPLEKQPPADILQQVKQELRSILVKLDQGRILKS
nr:MerR family transcriptional regulator [uncultured Desulfobulbus sp.]